jgi:hypothetical protein
VTERERALTQVRDIVLDRERDWQRQARMFRDLANADMEALFQVRANECDLIAQRLLALAGRDEVAERFCRMEVGER